MTSLADAIRSPELFPHALNVAGNAVKFIRLSRADYESASFLDERVLGPQTSFSLVPWPDVTAAIEAAALAETCHFIFHIGHVGSTLISRLLGDHPATFALREPLILRTLAKTTGEPGGAPAESAEGHSARLRNSLKLLSRTFDPDQVAVVKATSFVSEIAADLMARPSAPKALLMLVSPESYIATILGGANSRREAALLTPGRAARLRKRLGHQDWQTESLSEGETLALGWACEMTGLAQAARVAPEHVLRMDFDAFLLDPAPQLFSALRHFGIATTAAEVARILNGPIRFRYSKGPEHAYDAQLRREVLAAARADHGAEIRRGLAWLERAAVHHKDIRAAWAFAAGPGP